MLLFYVNPQLLIISPIKKVKPLNDYKIMLTFENNENRIFDLKPLLNKGIFKELKDPEIFKTVHISFDSIEWDNSADLDSEILH